MMAVKPVGGTWVGRIERKVACRVVERVDRGYGDKSWYQ